MSNVKGETPRDAEYAKGGSALGRTRDFMKEPDAFRSDTGPGAKQDYGKAGSAGALAKTTGDKCLPTIKGRN
jgi:hypothetical protein